MRGSAIFLRQCHHQVIICKTPTAIKFAVYMQEFVGLTLYIYAKDILLIWHTLKRQFIIYVYAQRGNPYKVNINKVLDFVLGISVGHSNFVQSFDVNSKYSPKIFHSHVLTRHCIAFLYMLYKRSCHADREAATTVVIEYFSISWVEVSL